MTLMKMIKDLFSDPCTDPDPLLSLILTAVESEGVGSDLLYALSQEPFHRKSLINGMASEMELRGADTAVVAAIRRLEDDVLAEKIRSFLAAEEG